jgi:hypothetical protein
MLKRHIWFVSILFGLCILLGFAGCTFDTSSRIEGVIQLENQSNHQGIDVYLPGTQFRAVTNQDGKFVIDNIPPNVYTLLAEKDGYITYEEEIILAKGNNQIDAGIILPVVLPKNGSISGFITIPGQTTHAGIMVMVVDQPYSTVTNTTGFFELTEIPPGNYSVLAYMDDYLPSKQTNINVAANGKTKLPDQTLTHSSNQIINSGTDTGSVLGSQVIQGYAFLQGSLQHEGITITLKSQLNIKTITDATGFYILEGLDSNLHSLLFTHEGYVTEELSGIESVPQTSKRTTSFVTLRREGNYDGDGILQGKVLLQGKENHANTIVRLVGNSQPVVTDSEGKYLFVGVKAGKYELVADHPGYETKRVSSIDILADQINPAPDVVLIPNAENAGGLGSISGIAFLENETDYSGILVALEGTSHTIVTGPDGAYQFNEIEAGYYTVNFSKSDYKDAYFEGASVVANENSELEPVMLQLDIEPPYVMDVFPPPNTRDVPIVQWVDVMVKFSERMNGDSVKEAVMIDPPVSYEAFFDRESDLSDMDVLHIRLHQNAPEPIYFNTIYTIAILPFAQTPKGVEMEEPFEFSFQTDGPLIVGSIPRQGETDFMNGLADPVLIETNAPVDEKSVMRSLRFRPRPESEPVVQINPIGLGSQILVYVAFKPDTRYQVMFDQNMRTIDGTRFSNAPYSLSFTTRGNDTVRSSQSRRLPPSRR